MLVALNESIAHRDFHLASYVKRLIGQVAPVLSTRDLIDKK